MRVGCCCDDDGDWCCSLFPPFLCSFFPYLYVWQIFLLSSLKIAIQKSEIFFFPLSSFFFFSFLLSLSLSFFICPCWSYCDGLIISYSSRNIISSPLNIWNIISIFDPLFYLNFQILKQLSGSFWLFMISK